VPYGTFSSVQRALCAGFLRGRPPCCHSINSCAVPSSQRGRGAIGTIRHSSIPQRSPSDYNRSDTSDRRSTRRLKMTRFNRTNPLCWRRVALVLLLLCTSLRRAPIAVFRITRAGRKLRTGLLLLCVLCNPWTCLASNPNVVIFLIDDLGSQDLRCYGNGLIDTPNIDQLAAEGMRWTQAYSACPVCSPTRVAVLTGKSPARVRFTGHITDIPKQRHHSAG